MSDVAFQPRYGYDVDLTTAEEESGHAAVAIALGHRVVAVAANRPGKSLDGVVRTEYVDHGDDPLVEMRRCLVERLMMRLAGKMAVHDTPDWPPTFAAAATDQREGGMADTIKLLMDPAVGGFNSEDYKAAIAGTREILARPHVVEGRKALAKFLISSDVSGGVAFEDEVMLAFHRPSVLIRKHLIRLSRKTRDG